MPADGGEAIADLVVPRTQPMTRCTRLSYRSETLARRTRFGCA